MASQPSRPIFGWPYLSYMKMHREMYLSSSSFSLSRNEAILASLADCFATAFLAGLVLHSPRDQLSVSFWPPSCQAWHLSRTPPCQLTVRHAIFLLSSSLSLLIIRNGLSRLLRKSHQRRPPATVQWPTFPHKCHVNNVEYLSFILLIHHKTNLAF